jgi:large subunit ribosomal protein L21
MYAVVTTGGKQYRVEAGSELIVERLAAEPGASITFDRVLLVGDGEAITVGSPTVDGASVSGTVLGEELGPKLIIFKFKQKVKYRRTAGHRQHLTRVRIDEISAGGKRSKAEPADAAKAGPSEKARSGKAEAKVETAEAKGTATEATESRAEAPAKPARARKPAAPKAKADAKADDAKPDEADSPKAKPATRRRTTPKKPEAEE